ncbi:PRELI-like family domain-containing protein [Ditylenchus destructor]|uniref:PRELI-like family domain-containing protein n=1 Tax=Ditylenchus destructor TaxID=166010 RepID=A0AAD4RAJ2_9BILA|nr:PRELI-like family domain-containing protein [Ditylenchus destructor]
MKIWEAPLHVFNFDFDDVASVFYDRYPNSFAKHVISEDVLSREITEDKIITRKIIVKSAATFLKSVPKWISRISDRRYMPTLEESVYDRNTKTLTTYTRNISWNNTLSMDERCVYLHMSNHTTYLHRHFFIGVNYGRVSGMLERLLSMAVSKSTRKTAEGLNEKLQERFGALGNMNISNTSANRQATPSNVLRDTIITKFDKA